MKTTTTINEVITSELINNGLNEFINIVNGRKKITMNDDKFTFIRKIAQYDTDVQKVVNRTLFMNYKFTDEKTDKFFKHAFITRFLDRQIANQTIDLFANHLVSFCILNESYIQNLVNNFDKYLKADANTDTTSESKSNDGNNSASISLPQDNVNLDLGSNTADYADTNDIYRAYNNATNKSNNHSTTYNADVLDKLNEQWDNIMYRFDKKLFLQIW